MHPSFIFSNDGAEKFISRESVASQKLLNLCWSVSCFVTHLTDSFRYPGVSVMVSCSRNLEICGNIVESSSTVNLRSSRSASSIFSTISSVNWRSSAPLIIMHRRTTVFKLATPLEHTSIIHSFITICSFYLIINLNWSFSFPNEITDEAAYFTLGRLDWHFSWNLLSHRQFSMYWPRTGLVEGRTVWPTCRKKIPLALRASVHLISGQAS